MKRLRDSHLRRVRRLWSFWMDGGCLSKSSDRRFIPELILQLSRISKISKIPKILGRIAPLPRIQKMKRLCDSHLRRVRRLWFFRMNGGCLSKSSDRRSVPELILQRSRISRIGKTNRSTARNIKNETLTRVSPSASRETPWLFGGAEAVVNYNGSRGYVG